MKSIEWDEAKNSRLKIERGVSFEEVAGIVQENKTLDIIPNPNKKKYPHQRIFIVKIEEYVHLVPFVEDETKIFLKTIIPSRKFTKKYLVERKK